jgi:hypothetical protein
MRWNIPEEPEHPVKGDKRIIKRWAFPKSKRIKDKKVWLERYWVIQTFGKREWSDLSYHFYNGDKSKPKLEEKSKKLTGKDWAS